MTVAEYLMGWNTWAVLCLVAGLLLLISEMFTPGLGIPALLGGLFLLGAVVLRADSLYTAVITLLLIIIPIIIAAAVVFRSFQNGVLARSRIVLHDSIDGSSTPLSGEDVQGMAGAEGVCLTDLRPSGKGDFSGKRLDVVSEGEFIKKGEKIKIDRIDGLSVIVVRA